MRRLRRNFRKNQSKIILTTAFALVFCLCVGYAAFQTVINFNVKGNIKKKLLTPRDLTKNVVTTGDGLYADTTEEGRYIYRGANPNNYIKLGSDMYRIISVESDNTLKVIKNGSIGTKAFDEAKARYSTNSTDYCNEDRGCKVWGSKTTTLDSSGKNVTQMPREVGGTLYNLPDKEATLNIYLNNDWYNSLSSNVQNIVVSHMFNVGVTEGSETSLANTITQEQTYKWLGKVGFMNVSDYIKANNNVDSCGTLSLNQSNYSTCKTTNWIFASFASTYSWIIAPYSGSSTYFVFFVSSEGYPSGINAGGGRGVAPVLYLSFNISFWGDGTSDSPYTVE